MICRVVGLSAFLARSIFGSPILSTSDVRATCLSVTQYSDGAAPTVKLNLAVLLALIYESGS